MAANSHNDTSVQLEPRYQICVIGEKLKQKESLLEALKFFQLPVVYSSSGIDLINEGGEFKTIFVLEEFQGDVFGQLKSPNRIIVGPTVVMQYAEQKKSLPPLRFRQNRQPKRPMYTAAMENLLISFSGFRSKEELSLIVELIHHMGGSIPRHFSITKTTHLVADPNATCGEKYKFAASSGIPIMTKEWVTETWARRHDVKCYATDQDLMQFKLLPFVGCKLAFLGYSPEEEQHMTDVTIKNGGEVVQSSDPSCTHIVVELGFVVDISQFEQDPHILKNEWFWACIQIEAKAGEGMYIYENPNLSMSSSIVVPTRGNKRKRLESLARQLAIENLDTDYMYFNSDLHKKSEVKLSISGSFLDATFSPEKSLDCLSDNEMDKRVKSPPLDMRSLTPRQQVCLELFQTESNYVSILHTIMTVFKEPLEKPDQAGGSLLAPAEIKIIFGNLPPIYETHLKIRQELADVVHSKSDDHSIGDLILNHAQELMKAYPPFVNFFEKSKEILAHCDASKPRFHAFLKRCQSKPECGRQTLQELLIRPVQRLPSVILLLNDLLKRTPKSNPDNQALEKAIQALKDVMMHINEDKRKTEGQVEMFDIVNDIENCPPNLLSSHRTLVSKTDMQEVTDLLNKKGGLMTMFLFTDVLEICKKRNRAANSLKSPGVVAMASGTMRPVSKSYKHLDLIQLSHIKRVVDVTETEDCKNTFAIVAWSSKEMKELLYAFILIENVCKSTFLRTLCRQIANSICKADSENLLTCLEPHQLDLHITENSGNALSKAFSKTRSKIGRAWSLRRTPTKRSFSRAVSTIISPLRSFGTPGYNLSSLKMSSVTNLAQLPSMFPEALLPLTNEWFNTSKSNCAREPKSRTQNNRVPVLRLRQLEERK